MCYSGEKTSTRKCHRNQAPDKERDYPCPVTVTRLATGAGQARLLLASACSTLIYIFIVRVHS